LRLALARRGQSLRVRAGRAPGAARRAYLLLSTFGDACARFVEELAARGYGLSVFAVRRYINERVTVLEVRRAGE
jgi:hypothetical protein